VTLLCFSVILIQQVMNRENLPRYFITDLPPDAEISASMIREAAETLKWNHDHILTERSTKDMVSLLAEVSDTPTRDRFLPG